MNIPAINRIALGQKEKEGQSVANEGREGREGENIICKCLPIV
jgi:hypothetical protein